MSNDSNSSLMSRIHSKETFMWQIIAGILVIVIVIMFLRNMIDPIILYMLMLLPIAYFIYKLLLRSKRIPLELIVKRCAYELRKQGLPVNRTRYTACYSPHDPNETLIDFYHDGIVCTYNNSGGMVEKRRSSLDEIRREKEESTTFAKAKRKIHEEERMKEELRKRGLYEEEKEG